MREASDLSDLPHEAITRRKPPLLPPAWRPEELAADDGGMKRSPHWLLAAIIGFFVIALAWAWLAHIDEIARGEGKVITASQTQYVQNLEGGIIEKILVQEGDPVKKDQVLFQLDRARFASAYREGRQGELGLRAKVARLTAEVRGIPLQMPAEVLNNAKPLADNEVAVHRARLGDLAGKNAVLREQLAQRTQEVVELRSRRERTEEQLEILKREIAITAPMVKEGAVSEVELLRLQRESTRISTDLDAATLAIPRAQSAIEEARRKMQDNESQFRSQAAGELSAARNELAKVAEAVPGLEDRMARTLVRSPVNGVVKTIANKTPGGVVQPGTPMAEIVAVEDSLLVEARIRPQDIAFVSVGQKATVKLAAYDYSIYGGVEGKLVYVSADSIQPQAQPGQSPEPYYVAHVRTLKPGVEYRGKILPVIPGMTGQVDVLTGRRSVLYYLLKPINKMLERSLTER
ncbi:MAG: HlyD family type I secretion periplasmic adaptor subunit [Betaproteobacteria bacterium]|nr:HlyD family type I secretion periplasmic adaptor subunit [Betaproteobacteria bacterium]